MVKLTSCLIFLLAFVFVFASAEYQITSPTASTVWRKNKFATVRWINNGPPDVKKTLIEILAGDPANLARVMVIKQSIDAKKRIFKFRVPKTLAAGTYVIRIGEIGHQVSYSHPFTVSE